MEATYKPYEVKKFISMAESQNSLELVYSSREEIVSKTIGFEGEVISEEKTEIIDTGYTGDKSKDASTQIEYWYDDYFLVYGNQKIKNKSNLDEVEKKRKVYFISTVQF